MIKEAVQCGNIRHSQWPGDLGRHLNLYLGSGRCGASFDPYGLMNCGYRGRFAEIATHTHLMHADHWHRGAYGIDLWLPAYKLVWADAMPPAPTHGYSQCLDLWTGVLRTEMSWAQSKVVLEASTNPGRPDTLALRIRHEGPMPALRLACVIDISTDYDQHIRSSFASSSLSACRWRGQVIAGSARSALDARIITGHGTLALIADPEGLRLDCRGDRGDHLLLIAVASPGRMPEVARTMDAMRTADQWQEDAAGAWARRWGTSFIHLGHREHQAMWARSLFWTLCSYGADVRSPAPPMGWSGNGWAFHFPQDLSYIHPALLRLGHFDIARAWVEFYRGYLDGMKAYTRRIYGKDGVFWAWEFPVGPGSEKTLNHKTVPNPYQFEIHNTAYPARMAFETALFLRDPKWTRDVAWPIVYESARFLAALASREASGRWSIHVVPSMGQDEMGGENRRNYLCSLFSTQYTLGKAIQMAAAMHIDNDDLPKFRRILADGLSFDRLLDPGSGLHATCEGIPIEKQVGFQKHPVQINPLVFLPLGRPVDDAVRRAYSRRASLCAGGADNFYYGWTLAAHWLAAAHQNDAAGLWNNLNQAVDAAYVDPEWIQIYETSRSYRFPFYVTSHGLFVQAVQDAVVSDYWGTPEIGAAAPDPWGAIEFAGLHTHDGQVWSGHRDANGAWETSATAAARQS
jgi:hypothetical protein